MPATREDFEAQARRINDYLSADSRFGHLRSYDYSDPDKLVVTCWEVDGGRPLVFELTRTKYDSTYVSRELPKTITEYDRSK